MDGRIYDFGVAAPLKLYRSQRYSEWVSLIVTLRTVQLRVGQTTFSNYKSFRTNSYVARYQPLLSFCYLFDDFTLFALSLVFASFPLLLQILLVVYPR